MATYLMTCEVSIGKHKTSSVNYMEVNSSWKELADKAVIRLPYLKGKIDKNALNESLADKFKEGDRVTIEMGYEGLDRSYSFEEFSGFVKKISPNIPLEIECEDAVYLLRQVNLEKSWRSTTLKDVVKYIIDQTNAANPEYKIEPHDSIPDVKFEKFTLDNVNGAEALQKIKEEYGLVAYFRDLKLFVGLAFTELSDTVKYSMAFNVKSSNLTYKRRDEVKIKLKAIAILKDNKTIEVEVGSKGGEMRTRFFYKISDKATLEKIANQEIDKLRFEGYQGDINTYLVPFVQHSMIADIQDPEFEQKNGKYIVDSVKTVFDKGINRTVTIGKKI